MMRIGWGWDEYGDRMEDVDLDRDWVGRDEDMMG